MANQLLVTEFHVLPWWVALIPLMWLVAALLKSPRAKGWIGETLLHGCLRIGLERSRYHLFRNLILPTPDGTTQVDHVIVSAYGIFVIETKNYAGLIFGSERDKMWTQKLGRRSFSFQNPLRQNYKHVRALAELTGVEDRVLFSLIVFVGGSTFKTPMPDNVTRAGGCLANLRSRKDKLLSEAEVEAVIARIGKGRIAPSRAANAAHARHVQTLMEQRKGGAAMAATAASTPAQRAARSPLGAATTATTMRTEPQLVDEPRAAASAASCCPQCGGALGDYTFRSGAKTGQVFRGCTRFPDCSYRAHLPAPATSESALAPA